MNSPTVENQTNNSTLEPSKAVNWPEGKKFAFSVFDDTDGENLTNAPPVYEFLRDLGLFTTKSVWPIIGENSVLTDGSTCEDADYLKWLLQLQEEGFEIGYHMASSQSSERMKSIEALELFEKHFGATPTTMAAHSACAENLYWGSERLTGFNKFIYRMTGIGRQRRTFAGHIPNNKYFWGDIAKGKITYMRNFVFPQINTLKACPFFPYHDPLKPYVNYWFASSEGANVNSFTNLLSEENQNKLQSEAGACIVYTHFGSGFAPNGKLDSRFKKLMLSLSKKNGWFVPVSTMLNHLRNANGNHTITNSERSQLERQWLRFKLLKGTS